jgi:flagellar hook-length control protein FliK
MAISAASAVSTAPAVDNTAKANTSVAGTGNGSDGSFTDSLDAVLAEPGATNTKTSPRNDNDAKGASHAHGKHAGLKRKLKNGEFGAAAFTPQMLQQQQATIRKLGDTSSGIDIPALRAAMGKGGHVPGKMHILPSANPLTGKIEAPQVPATADTPDDVANPSAAAQNIPAADDPAVAANAPVTNKASATGKHVGGDPSDAAANKATTQEKLAAALVKTANAPVLKTGQADGSKVPNAKIGHHAHTRKTATADATSDEDTVKAMAVKIAATAGATNNADNAQVAAKGVATAEVATKTAPAAPATVTKIETAAMANATQTATHAPTAQAKIEAQALPVQFDAKIADSKDSDTNSKSGDGDKSHARSGSVRTAADAQKQPSAPAPTSADTQPSTPAPAPVNSAPADTNLATAANANANANGANPVAPPQIATTLHVSPQPQHDAPADDATFAALGVAIAAKSKDGEKQFDINMHPAELGRVDVRISVDAAGKTQAHLSAEHPHTLQMLQNDKGTLERSLRDAGLDVSSNGLSFSLKGEQQPSTPTFSARSRALSISAVQTADVSSTSSHASLAPGDSRLDIRV